MRVVYDENGLSEEIESAKREALNAFGDERLLIEKYLADDHHVEFQVFGDKHGNLVHLFEREYSIQCRHQKIKEVLEKRESKSRPNAGIVKFRHWGKKSDGMIKIEFERTAMFLKKPRG